MRARLAITPSRTALGVLLALGIVANICWATQVESRDNPFLVIRLLDGRTITLELFPDEAPETVDNLLTLVEDRYYDGLVFHRVEDWVVQTGAMEADGTGGPPWTIERELTERPNIRGAVGMALVAGDPNSGSSQFYVLRKDSPHLDGGYCVFGRVLSGMEVVDSMTPGEPIETIRRVSYEDLPD